MRRRRWGCSTNKFGAQKAIVDFIEFDSRLEAALYTFLKTLVMAGELREIKRQIKVYLTRAKILYKVDFEAEDVATGRPVFYEAKGYPTASWNLKKRLWKSEGGPGILRIYGGDYRAIKFQEEIIPDRRNESILNCGHPCRICLRD